MQLSLKSSRMWAAWHRSLAGKNWRTCWQEKMLAGDGWFLAGPHLKMTQLRLCINQWNENHHPEPKIYLKICFKKNKIAQLAQKIVREMSSTTCSSCSSIWEAVGWYLLLKYWGILGRRKNRRKQMFHKQPNLNNSLIFKFKPKWFLLRKIFSYYYSLLLIFVVNLTKRIIRGDTKLSGNIFKFLYPHYKP